MDACDVEGTGKIQPILGAASLSSRSLLVLGLMWQRIPFVKSY